jgi:Rieske Fe-S protein
MKNVDMKKVFARREVIGAGAIGVAYLMLPEGCGGSSPDKSDAGSPDSTAPEGGAADAQPEATLPDATTVDGGGACKQDDWTRPISIMKTGIAIKGTAYAFQDPRFADLYFGADQLLLINPLRGSGYVAMSGVCSHRGCTPQYFSTCVYSDPDGGIPQCSVPDASDGGEEADTDVDAADAGSEAEAAEAGSDGAADAEEGTELLTDVLFCPCHQSVFNALNGKAIKGPALATGDLQILDTCVGGGYVFVTIPCNPGAPYACEPGTP